MGLTDGALVRRAAGGDVAAFEALVDRHYGDCLRYALRMLGNRADAEEVVQETFVRAYRALGRYKERQRFKAWLYRILVNRCRSAAARERRGWLRFRGYSEAVIPPGESPGIENCEVEESIRQALAELPIPQREAFILKHVEEMSYEEISAETGVGVSALKMRVKRARERLADLLRDDDEQR